MLDISGLNVLWTKTTYNSYGREQDEYCLTPVIWNNYLYINKIIAALLFAEMEWGGKLHNLKAKLKFLSVEAECVNYNGDAAVIHILPLFIRG